MSGWWLLADIGGTNARLAVSEGPGHVAFEHAYGTQALSSLDEALADFVSKLSAPWCLAACRGARIAAAGPVENDTVKLTNASWHVRGRDVSERLGGVSTVLLNDLEAVAALLPHLHPTEVRLIGDAPLSPERSHAVAINVGTGLGAAALVNSRSGQRVPVGGEPGHFTFAVADVADAPLLGHAATFEDFLSGRGIGHLYDVVAGLEKDAGTVPAVPRGSSAEVVFAAAGTDPIAAQCVRHVSRMLGRFAGDLVLATAAWDGAFLCGSVVGGWAALCDAEEFRAAFEAKGAMRARMRSVPSAIILAREPALLGLSHLAEDA